MQPSSAKGMRAFCCDSRKILQPISSSRCSMPSCFFLLIPDATAGLLNLADTLLRVIASGQVRAVARGHGRLCSLSLCADEM